METSKRIIFTDGIMTIWPYAYESSDDGLIYTKITSVHKLNDMIYFSTNYWTKSYAKTTGNLFVADNLFIASYEYLEHLYELYEANPIDAEYPSDSVRLDKYHVSRKKYATIDQPITRKPIKEIIQDITATLVDTNDIIHATIIYDCQWPNYVVSRNAYCDIILKAIK